MNLDIIQFAYCDMPPEYYYDGCVAIGTISQSGEYRYISSPKISELKSYLAKMDFYNTNYYLTANTFKGHRTPSEDNLFALHNIVIDLDIHCDNMNDDQKQYILGELEFELLGIAMPMPNIIHHTGRGLQLWYCLEPMSIKLYWAYKNLRTIIISNIQYLIDKNHYPIVLDSQSKKAAGYFRLFDTYNTHVTHISSSYIFNYNKLNVFDFLDLTTEYTLNKTQNSNYPIKAANTANENYIGLHHKRTCFIEWLITERNYPTNNELRDINLFLFYNAAKQYLSQEMAVAATKKINRKFKEPLSDRDLNTYIFKYLDKKNYLKFKTRTFYQWLNVSSAEKEAFEKAHPPKSNFTRNHNRKIAKELRNSLVKKYHNEGYTYAQIIAKMKATDNITISKNTITAILKKAE